MRILVSHPLNYLGSHKRSMEQGVRRDLAAAARQLGISLSFINHTEYCRHLYSPSELDIAFRNRDPALCRLYSATRAALSNHEAFLVFDINVYHPDFLVDLPCYKALYSPDDPNSSFERSMPYAYAFDCVFSVTPRYNHKISMPEQFRKWGCPRSYTFPIGAISSEFSVLDETQIFSRERTIPCIFIGAPSSTARINQLLAIKKALKQRFYLYGNWNWRLNIKASVKHRMPVWVSPCNSKTEQYLQTKIGINMHVSSEYGFGNRRTFELPINGVMQICDFKNSDLPDFFEVGKEVVGYETIGEAIQLAEYYLQHDDARKEIAVNGFRKAKQCYLFANIFERLLRTLMSDMGVARRSNA